jgi:hypothetical protein
VSVHLARVGVRSIGSSCRSQVRYFGYFGNSEVSFGLLCNPM